MPDVLGFFLLDDDFLWIWGRGSRIERCRSFFLRTEAADGLPDGNRVKPCRESSFRIEPVDIPEDLGKFVIIEYQKSAEFGGQNIGQAYMGILTPKDKDPVKIMLPLHFPNFDKMRRGSVVISVAEQKTKKFNPGETSDQRYYTGLQITKDPGVWVVYTGFIGIIIGILSRFSCPIKECVSKLLKAAKTAKS